MVTEHDEHEHDEHDWDDGEEHPADPRRSLRVRARSALLRARQRVESIRTEWDVNVTAAAVVAVHPDVLHDQPRLRSVIDNDLRAQIDAVYPLRWRYDDLRHHARQAARAALGRPVQDVPWEWRDAVDVTSEGAGYFERNLTLVRAERRKIRHVRA